MLQRTLGLARDIEGKLERPCVQALELSLHPCIQGLVGLLASAVLTIAIQETLYGLMRGKTVIAIAHRLSTIAAMDRIVVLDDGHIAESGTHAELLASGGLYARFWARQSGGFIGLEEAAE
jgi:hypothetical protein